MADKALVDARRSIDLPDDADVAKVAAAMNPAMSSWVALRRRVPIEPGQSVLVLGVTGNAGAMAVQMAKRLGAGRVVGAGPRSRSPARAHAVGADDIVQLTDDRDATGNALAAAAAEVDIVIDYLWGKPAQQAMIALLTARSDRSRAMNWIQIGAVAGPTIELPSVALRSANFRLQGSGQGAVSPGLTWPSCRRWWTRSTRARSRSNRTRCRWRRSRSLEPGRRTGRTHGTTATR